MKNERRAFMRSLAVSAGGLAALGETLKAGPESAAALAAGTDSTVRDRLWMWGHLPGYFNNMYNVPGSSRMTAGEGALYLGVPNVVMVSFLSPDAFCKATPVPSYKQHLISLRSFKRVSWAIGDFGSDRRIWRGLVGRFAARDLKLVWELAAQSPNLVSAHLDVFFRDSFGGRRVSTFTLDELNYLVSQLKLAGQKLDFSVSLYRHDLPHNPAPYLSKADVVSFWTRSAKDLESLEDGLAGLEKAAPNARKMLGCCMWDFDGGKPMPLALMQKQCRVGLEALRAKRIEGIVFRASPLCDLNLAAVEWTRSWIREVGNNAI